MKPSKCTSCGKDLMIPDDDNYICGKCRRSKTKYNVSYKKVMK